MKESGYMEHLKRVVRYLGGEYVRVDHRTNGRGHIDAVCVFKHITIFVEVKKDGNTYGTTWEQETKLDKLRRKGFYTFVWDAAEVCRGELLTRMRDMIVTHVGHEDV